MRARASVTSSCRPGSTRALSTISLSTNVSPFRSTILAPQGSTGCVTPRAAADRTWPHVVRWASPVCPREPAKAVFQFAGAVALARAVAPSSCERRSTTASAIRAASNATPPSTSRRCAKRSITCGSVADQVVGAAVQVRTRRSSFGHDHRPNRTQGIPEIPVVSVARIRSQTPNVFVPRAPISRSSAKWTLCFPVEIRSARLVLSWSTVARGAMPAPREPGSPTPRAPRTEWPTARPSADPTRSTPSETP